MNSDRVACNVSKQEGTLVI